MVSISPKARIGKNSRIREFTVIEDDVIIGDNVEIGPSAFIGNGARIGNDVKILHASAIGVWPNSVTYNNENSTTEIGDGTIIKGHSTVCRGTKHSMRTIIGKNCYIMNHVHVAHDNIIGDNVTLVNGVNNGGHVEIGDYANIGGLVGIHQFCKVGKYVMVESSTKIHKDIPPYILAGRLPIRYHGLNLVGLRRNGFSTDVIQNIKNAYRVIYDSGLNFKDALEKLKSEFELTNEIKEIINFIKKSTRGILAK
ncbi:MAG: acyl-ACP--UDP-N-acetylglucosamine O-acyltransferase [Ignavibacteria bacterium]